MATLLPRNVPLHGPGLTSPPAAAPLVRPGVRAAPGPAACLSLAAGCESDFPRRRRTENSTPAYLNRTTGCESGGPAGWPGAALRLLAVLLALGPACAVASGFEVAVRAAETGDFETARREFAALAASGDPRGENGLGVLYVRGQGLEQDFGRALELFRSAADKGLRAARKNLGEMYAEGAGVARDDAAALHWFGLAAAQGDADAQFSLGLMYGQGRGVERDYAKAMEWFLKAAEQGNAAAQANVGHLYRAGYGVGRDYVLAYAWYGVAAANDFKMGPELRESVAEYLTPTQLEQARAIARGIWKKFGAPD